MSLMMLSYINNRQENVEIISTYVVHHSPPLNPRCHTPTLNGTREREKEIFIYGIEIEDYSHRIRSTLYHSRRLTYYLTMCVE